MGPVQAHWADTHAIPAVQFLLSLSLTLAFLVLHSSQDWMDVAEVTQASAVSTSQSIGVSQDRMDALSMSQNARDIDQWAKLYDQGQDLSLRLATNGTGGPKAAPMAQIGSHTAQERELEEDIFDVQETKSGIDPTADPTAGLEEQEKVNDDDDGEDIFSTQPTVNQCVPTTDQISRTRQKRPRGIACSPSVMALRVPQPLPEEKLPEPKRQRKT